MEKSPKKHFSTFFTNMSQSYTQKPNFVTAASLVIGVLFVLLSLLFGGNVAIFLSLTGFGIVIFGLVCG